MRYVQTVGGGKGTVVRLVGECPPNVQVQIIVGKYKGFIYSLSEKNFEKYYKEYKRKRIRFKRPRR